MIHAYKKAGLHCCCSAFRGSGIALVSEQATPSPRRYVQPHTPIYDVARIRIYISRGHQNAAMCWILMNLPDSEMPSTKRI